MHIIKTTLLNQPIRPLARKAQKHAGSPGIQKVRTKGLKPTLPHLEPRPIHGHDGCAEMVGGQERDGCRCRSGLANDRDRTAGVVEDPFLFLTGEAAGEMLEQAVAGVGGVDGLGVGWAGAGGGSADSGGPAGGVAGFEAVGEKRPGVGAFGALEKATAIVAIRDLEGAVAGGCLAAGVVEGAVEGACGAGVLHLVAGSVEVEGFCSASSQGDAGEGGTMTTRGVLYVGVGVCGGIARFGEAIADGIVGPRAHAPGTIALGEEVLVVEVAVGASVGGRHSIGGGEDVTHGIGGELVIRAHLGMCVQGVRAFEEKRGLYAGRMVQCTDSV